MFDELFRRKTVDVNKAVMFGFVQNNSNYIYETEILDGSPFFGAKFVISATSHTSNVSQNMI